MTIQMGSREIVFWIVELKLVIVHLVLLRLIRLLNSLDGSSLCIELLYLIRIELLI